MSKAASVHFRQRRDDGSPGRHSSPQPGLIVTSLTYPAIDAALDERQRSETSGWTRGHFGPGLSLFFDPMLNIGRLDTPARSVAVLGGPGSGVKAAQDNQRIAVELLKAFEISPETLDEAISSSGDQRIILYRYGGDVWLSAVQTKSLFFQIDRAGSTVVSSRAEYARRLSQESRNFAPAFLASASSPRGLKLGGLEPGQPAKPKVVVGGSRAPIKAAALDILKQRNVPIGAILDVGVLHGTSELVGAFPNVKHHLFEPVDEFTAKIRENYAAIDYELHQVAVGEASGTITLRTSSKLEGMAISHSSMDFNGPAHGEDARVVPMVSLDDVLRNMSVPTPYLLKIDIDGHEMKVLRGARKTLEDTAVVIIECVHSTIPERLAFLQSAGFRLFDLAEPCYYDKVFWQCDAVFLRRDLFERHFTELKGSVAPGLYEMFQ